LAAAVLAAGAAVVAEASLFSVAVVVEALLVASLASTPCWAAGTAAVGFSSTLTSLGFSCLVSSSSERVMSPFAVGLAVVVTVEVAAVGDVSSTEEAAWALSSMAPSFFATLQINKMLKSKKSKESEKYLSRRGRGPAVALGVRRVLLGLDDLGGSLSGNVLGLRLLGLLITLRFGYE
jgi:hypothetical protein